MSDQTTTIARYRAVGNAHVTVTKTVRSITFDDEPETQIWFAVACESCGQVGNIEYAREHRRVGYLRLYDDEAEKHALQTAETTAADHAAACRRIPERLWPEGGGAS